MCCSFYVLYISQAFYKRNIWYSIECCFNSIIQVFPYTYVTWTIIFFAGYYPTLLEPYCLELKWWVWNRAIYPQFPITLYQKGKKNNQLKSVLHRMCHSAVIQWTFPKWQLSGLSFLFLSSRLPTFVIIDCFFFFFQPLFRFLSSWLPYITLSVCGASHWSRFSVKNAPTKRETLSLSSILITLQDFAVLSWNSKINNMLILIE